MEYGTISIDKTLGEQQILKETRSDIVIIVHESKKQYSAGLIMKLMKEAPYGITVCIYKEGDDDINWSRTAMNAIFTAMGGGTVIFILDSMFMKNACCVEMMLVAKTFFGYMKASFHGLEIFWIDTDTNTKKTLSNNSAKKLLDIAKISYEQEMVGKKSLVVIDTDLEVKWAVEVMYTHIDSEFYSLYPLGHTKTECGDNIRKKADVLRERGVYKEHHSQQMLLLYGIKWFGEWRNVKICSCNLRHNDEFISLDSLPFVVGKCLGTITV